MVLHYCSIREVLAKLVRDTRVQDSSYLLDAHEWIPEALALCHSRGQSVHKFWDERVRFFRVAMPCDLVTLQGIEYEGRRLTYSSSSRMPRFTTGQDYPVDTLAAALPATETVGDHLFHTTDHLTLSRLPWTRDAYYTTEPGSILTSFESGCLRIHGLALATDGDGLPLIPDNPNLKEALYLYCRYKMIGTGWADPVFRMEQLYQLFESTARRAINDMTRFTVEKAEAALQNSVRLLPPEGYYNSFFQNPAPEGNLNFF